MRRPAILLVAGLLAAGCIAPPDDAGAIRRLLRDEATARARGDRDALYRMHDPDFRAICPRAGFRVAAPEPMEAPVVEAIEVRGSHGWATVTSGGGRLRRPLIKDAGRWYLYGDAQACVQRSGFGVRRWPSPSTRSQHQTPNPERVTVATVPADG